jgi:ribosomal protein L30
MQQGSHVQSLFVTLRRGYAGTPWFHRRILEALGLQHRHQCVEKPNNASIRGMLSKVRQAHRAWGFSASAAQRLSRPVKRRPAGSLLGLTRVGSSWRGCLRPTQHQEQQLAIGFPARAPIGSQ